MASSSSTGGSSPGPLGQAILGSVVSAASHPVFFAKSLIQFGYEPIAPVPGKTLLRKNVLVLPNVLQYINHIRTVDGFTGMYRGLAPRLVSGALGSLVTSSVMIHLSKTTERDGVANAEKEIDGDEDVLEGFKLMMRETCHETIARCAGLVAFQPFHVIALRSMAQFVGRETTYSSMWSGIVEIYNKDGIIGFFVGLTPRLIGEALAIWLANIISYLLKTYVIPKDRSYNEIRNYTSPAVSMLVSQFTYPFSLVSSCMAVNNCGLEVGSPPYMPVYNGWRNCWHSLSSQGEIKRGSAMFWRYFYGPTIIRDGQILPAKQVFAS